MPASKYLTGCLIALLAFLASCQETVIQETVHDNVIYEVDTVSIYTSNVEKDKLKSSIQFISILYADLFKQAITSATLARLDELKLSIGDKGLANEMIITDFLQDAGVELPSDADMRNDIASFVNDTYIRFYARQPTEYEAYYMASMIEQDPGMTPALVYLSFMLSDEYLYY